MALVTIENILQLEGFQNAKVVAGAAGMHLMVNNAMLMEVPDIFPYVEKNNLLITTLFPVYEDEKAMEELIPRLSELGVSGICIKPFRYIGGIPERMKEQADALSFPVIELPKEANLSGLVTEILEISLKKHMDVLNFRNNVHDRLMGLFLEGREIPELLQSLADICQSEAVLLDASYKVLHRSGEACSPCYTFTGTPERGVLKVHLGEKLLSEEDYILHPIRAGARLFGYLLLLKENGKSDSLQVAAEEASLLIASVYFKNYAVMEKERSFQDSFIRDILQGKVTSPMETINKARYFGWNMEFPQVILVLKIFAGDEKMKKTYYEEVMDEKIIDGVLERELRLTGKKFKYVYLDDSIVIFINTIFLEKREEALKNAAEKLLHMKKTEMRLGIGISEEALSILELPSSYRQAKMTLEIGSLLKESSFTSSYRDYEMFSLLREMKDKVLLEAFVEKKLGRLLLHEKTHSGDLLKTLQVLLEENLNAKNAAKKLFIHYNTMRHRIDKLKELGVELEQGFSLGELVFAYYAYIWQEAEKSRERKEEL